MSVDSVVCKELLKKCELRKLKFAVMGRKLAFLLVLGFLCFAGK